ncbi:MAG: hypothetical protein CBD26_03545 [Candidatus Pelagibacter sp. TMED166]|nr:MAG: hypothetical protein CBD26_03545 [Candidatus Pelagibacter sp. TMED166]|tara:strand:- start:3515 stop:5086 length:1572 start_codon:yes stop_codon:yes gene_type:complete
MSENKIPPVDNFLQADFGVNARVNPFSSNSRAPINRSPGIDTRIDFFQAAKMAIKNNFAGKRTEDGINGILEARIIFTEEVLIENITDPIMKFYQDEIAGNQLDLEKIIIVYAAPKGGSCCMLTAPDTSEALPGNNPKNPDYSKIYRFPRFYAFPWTMELGGAPLVGQVCKVSYIDKDFLGYGLFHGMLNTGQNLLAVNNFSTRNTSAGASNAFGGTSGTSSTVSRQTRTGTNSGNWPPNQDNMQDRSIDVGFKKRFRNGSPRLFKQPPQLIVIHESGCRDLTCLEESLLNKGAGVHYTTQGDQAIQYESLKWSLIHCPGWNHKALGIEFNHRYQGPGEDIKPARWFSTKSSRYRIPSPTQSEALYALVSKVCRQAGIPFEFLNVSGDVYDMKPGMNSKIIGKDSKGRNRYRPIEGKAGIVSHHSATGNHSDGVFPTLYMALRQRGFDVNDAHRETIKILRNEDASGKAKGVRNGDKLTMPRGSGNPTPQEIEIHERIPMRAAQYRAMWAEKRKQKRNKKGKV